MPKSCQKLMKVATVEWLPLHRGRYRMNWLTDNLPKLDEVDNKSNNHHKTD